MRLTRRRPPPAAAGPAQSREPAGLAGAVGPAALEVRPRHVVVGDCYAATFAVVGYPAEVGPAWLEPLLACPGRIDLAVHIDPVPAPAAAAQLRRQRARFESTRRLDADRGRLGDPAVDAAAGDAAELAERIARGAAKLFRAGIYLTVHARTLDELADACAQARAAAASGLLDLAPATWRHHTGWASTLPLAADGLGLRRAFDTDALAAAFPLASADLPAPPPGQAPAPGGVLYGVNTNSAGIVWWDRWGLDNHNSVVLARSGAGKSYLVKLELLRCLHQGVRAAVIDPEDEYTRLAAAVGGTAVRLGEPGARLNPLDLPPGERRPDALTRRGMFAHTLIAVMLGDRPPPAEAAALDRAVIAAYAAAGITADPASWDRPAPLLRDAAEVLAADTDPPARSLAARLAPRTRGSFSDIFAGPTTTRPAGHLVVWSLRALPDQLRAAGTLLALDAIWREVDDPARLRPLAPGHAAGEQPKARAGARRLVVVDEAWLLLRDGEGARFLYRMAKAARKRLAGLTVITQDAADVLGTDLGRAVVPNAATQILMRQAAQSIDAVADAFGLTAGEAQLLLTARRGEALLVAGTNRVAFRVTASAAEDTLAQSEPGGSADPLFPDDPSR
jgi:type IV secretory pathway VirB4 component